MYEDAPGYMDTDSSVSKVDMAQGDQDSGTAVRYQSLLVGCLLAVGGNLLISVSLNLQKFTHMKIEAGETDKHYTQSPLWWLGMVLMGLGEVGNFAAYGFAPASVVAPLGTTTVIANAIIAVVILKEKLRPEDLFGAALAVLGAVLLVTFSKTHEQVLNSDQLVQALQQTTFIVYVVMESCMLIALFVLKYKFKKENVLVLLLICSVTASFTVISAKAVSGLLQLTMAGSMQLASVMFWAMLVVMILTAVIQIKYLNQAMKLFDATIVVPTNFVFFTISAILAGIIFYREFWGMKPLEIIMFLFGCLLCFVGVYFITAGRSKAKVEEQARQQLDDTHFINNILPSWLVRSINQEQVQPQTNNLGSYMTDTDPILNSINREDIREPHQTRAANSATGPIEINSQTRPAVLQHY